MKNNFKKAFSLIEISIVILIVGILIAGISKGIDMVYDMRLVTARALTDKSPVGSIENLELWLETTLENSLATGTASFTDVKNPNDSDPIGRWNDINPTLINPNNKNHAVQNTLSYQPLYIKDGINGLPALQFDGFDDFFSATDGRTNLSEFTIFIVAKPQHNQEPVTASNNRYSNVINISCSGGTTACSKISNSTGYTDKWSTNPAGWIFFMSPSSTNKTSIQFQYNMLSYDPNSSNFNIKYYGVSFTNNNVGLIANVNHGSSNVVIQVSPSYSVTSSSFPFASGSNSYLDFRIGAQKTSGSLDSTYSRNYKGHLSEIIIFSRSLNDKETLLIKNYLSEKWRIKL